MVVSGLDDDACQDASGADTQPPGREEIVVAGIGADACRLDALRCDAFGRQLPAVGFPKIDVPFVVAAGDVGHGKSRLAESLVDLIAHFKSSL